MKKRAGWLTLSCPFFMTGFMAGTYLRSQAFAHARKFTCRKAHLNGITLGKEYRQAHAGFHREDG